jgi:hypothetical protein
VRKEKGVPISHRRNIFDSVRNKKRNLKLGVPSFLPSLIEVRTKKEGRNPKKEGRKELKKKEGTPKKEGRKSHT